MYELVELASRVAELERRFSGMMRHGTVEEVDPNKQRIRLNFGKDEDGAPFLSPWIPYAQIAGALKIHTPPSKGQQFTSMSANGDWQQAVALPMTWSNQNPSPSSSGDENVLTFGDVRIEIRKNEVILKIGPTVAKLTGSKIILQADKIETVGLTKIGLDQEDDNGKTIATVAGPAKQAEAKV